MADVVYLVRHPDKEGDREGVYLGNDARITAHGHDQVLLTIARLKMLHPYLVLTSKLPRSIELGHVLAHELNAHVEQHALFDEIDKPQHLVGMKRSDPAHVAAMQAIRDCFDDDRVPEGVEVKSRSQLEEETRQAFTLFEGHRHRPSYGRKPAIVVVGHAKRIATYVHWALNGESLVGFYRTDSHLKLDTASITTLVREPDRRTGVVGWHVQSVNDTWHLQQGVEWQFQELFAKLEKAPVLH